MNTTLILVLVGGAVLVYIISIYNTLQQLKTQIQASIQEIGNQLKRQASLLPNLEAAVKGFMKHEKDIFTQLTDARKQVEKAQKSGSAKDIDSAVAKLQEVVPRISVLVESNPEMKSDATVTQFMGEIRDTADKLMYARRAVIDLSQMYNEKLVMFPSNLIAQLFGFKSEKGLSTPSVGEHLEVSEAETHDHKVSL